jgi:hypothetical protein
VNEHLAVVFHEMLPAITRAGLRYWVYGGVGVAGVAGRFLPERRKNHDVDIYVLNSEFSEVRSVLAGLCSTKPWRLKDYRPLKNGRPKFEVHANGLELLSVVPVYETPAGVELLVNTRLGLPAGALTQQLTEVDAYKFFSPSADTIKAILTNLLQHRRTDAGHLRWIDAKAIFTKDELKRILPDGDRQELERQVRFYAR